MAVRAERGEAHCKFLSKSILITKTILKLPMKFPKSIPLYPLEIEVYTVEDSRKFAKNPDTLLLGVISHPQNSKRMLGK